MKRKITPIILIIATLFIGSVRGDTNFYQGLGWVVNIPGPDDGSFSHVMASLSWEERDLNPWVYSISYFEDYPVYGQNVDNHISFSAGKRLLYYHLYQDMFMFFDLGLAAHNKDSVANSSYVTFYERVGLSVADTRFILTHTSNAGIYGANEGETAFLIEFKIEF